MTDARSATVLTKLPNSWYPVCSSHQLKRDRPFPIQAFGLDWVVFRTDNNRCAAVQRYCCHMGTDLALGSIRKNELQCPLHHWCFDGVGQCVNIPASERIPAEAKLSTLRCVERFGIVFVGHGPNTLFDFPDFANVNNDTNHIANSRPKLILMPAAYETVSLNLFDMQHLTTVHQRKLRNPAVLFSENSNHLGIRYSAYNARGRAGNRLARWLGLSANHIRVDCWGGNLLFISIEGRRPNFIMALMPNGEGCCLLYLAMVESSSSHAFGRIALTIKLETAAALTRSFIAEDIRTLSNARTAPGVLLPEVDAEAIRFWEYFGDLPRSGVSLT